MEVNSQGQVIGNAVRLGTDGGGYSPWFYDHNLGQTFDLTLSTRSDGYANGYVEYLGEDGVAMGYYNKFAEDDSSAGSRWFYFTVAEGILDITDYLLETGLNVAEVGWEYISETYRPNSAGQLTGNGGYLNDGVSTRGAFLLTPSRSTSVPEIDLGGAGIAFGLLAGLMAVCRERGKVRS